MPGGDFYAVFSCGSCGVRLEEAKTAVKEMSLPERRGEGLQDARKG